MKSHAELLKEKLSEENTLKLAMKLYIMQVADWYGSQTEPNEDDLRGIASKAITQANIFAQTWQVRGN